MRRINLMSPPKSLRHAHRKLKNNATLLPPVLYSHFQHAKLRTPPTHRDWRQSNVITPVKDQRLCGSCWAFAAVGALEAHIGLHDGNVVDLSVQQLIDCATDGNNGCHGGVDVFAYKYMQRVGVRTAQAYPYEAQEGECRVAEAAAEENVEGAVHSSESANTTSGRQQRPRVRRIVMLRSGNERLMRNAVGLVGPVSVSLDAGQRSFQFYAGGVYDEPLCGRHPMDLNHGMLAIGYGHQMSDRRKKAKKLKYWLLKNTMGTSWGEEGYMRLQRNGGNRCGVATAALYPVVL